MVNHLATATRVAGLTYRLLSTTVLIGVLAFGVYDLIRARKRR